MYRIDQSADRTLDAVEAALESLGVTVDASRETRVDGAVFDGDPTDGPSKWIVVDVGGSELAEGVSFLTVTVRDVESGAPHGTVEPDPELEAEILAAVAEVSAGEPVPVDSGGRAGRDGDGAAEWGPTRWEKR